VETPVLFSAVGSSANSVPAPCSILPKRKNTDLCQISLLQRILLFSWVAVHVVV
jgi:hypothetical protein